PKTPTCDKLATPVVAVLAEGDLVTVVIAREYKDSKDPSKTYTSTWFDMWRYVDGKADEHWDPATMPEVRTPLAQPSPDCGPAAPGRGCVQLLGSRRAGRRGTDKSFDTAPITCVFCARPRTEACGRRALTMRITSKSLTVLALLLLPAPVLAQGSLTGTVKDASGLVLPGVTVEAASPALIEKTRTAVTDGTGQYRIIHLRPRIYVGTATLPGFATVKRDNNEPTGTPTRTIHTDTKIAST